MAERAGDVGGLWPTDLEFDIDNRRAQLLEVCHTHQDHRQWDWPVHFPPCQTNQFSVACWTKIAHEADVHGQAWAHPLVSHASSGSGWELRLNSDIVEFLITGDVHYSACGDYSADGVTRIESERWYHIAGTFDGETVRVFVDGSLRGETCIGPAAGDLRQSKLADGTILPWVDIGRNPCWHDRRFKGSVAMVMVWQARVLVVQEVAALAGATPPESIERAHVPENNKPDAGTDVGGAVCLPDGFHTALVNDRALEPLLAESVAASNRFMRMEAQICKDGRGCPHTHCTYWGGAAEPWRCQQCSNALDPPRIPEEEVLRAKALNQDGFDPQVNVDRSLSMATTVEFLVAFSFVHSCWDWPTWRVVRDVIKPATAATRCRYAELPFMESSRGRADVFASHCWGAPWGDLVSAVAYGARRGRRVWVDIFAVRQWPGNDGDLDFTGVVSGCDAFVLSATSLPRVSRMPVADAMGRDAKRKINPDDRKLMASFRVWCLVELAEAMKQQKAVIMRVGAHQFVQDRAAVVFNADLRMLRNLKYLIDVQFAEATVPADHERILHSIRQLQGGFDAVNSLIVGAILGASEVAALGMPAVEAAACGEIEALEGLDHADHAKALCAAAAGGYSEVCQALLDLGAKIDIGLVRQALAGDHAGVLGLLLVKMAGTGLPCGSLLMEAAMHGHSKCVAVLAAAGADLDAQHNDVDGATPLILGAGNGHKAVVEELLRAKAGLEVRDDKGVTPLIWSASWGHKEIAQALIDAKANLEAKDDRGMTSLIHTSGCRMAGANVDVMHTLVNAKASLSARDDLGHTALDAAIIADATGHSGGHAASTLRQLGAYDQAP